MTSHPWVDGTCTYLTRDAHRRADRVIGPKYCGQDPKYTLSNPVTGDMYYMCSKHWDDKAVYAAERMGLVVAESVTR